MQFYAAKKMYATNMLKDAMEAVRLGKEWLETSQYKEALALLREEQGPAAAGQTGAEGDWSELMMSNQRDPWAKLKDSCYQARQEDDQRKSIVQHTVQGSTDFLRRIIVPVAGRGRTVVRAPS